MRLIANLILTVIFFIWPVFLPSNAFSESPPEAAEKAATEMPFIKEAGERYSGRFLLKKAGSQYVPNLNNGYGPSADKTLDAITIPGTEIRAGVFRYEYIDERGKHRFTRKNGLLINDTIYYVESSSRNDRGVFDSSGDPHFGVYKNYFTMDACAHGASSCNNRMFLFRYTKNSVELLDVIMATYNLCADFMSAIEPERGRYKDTPAPWWTKIDDIDNDGNPEIQIWISCAFRLEKTFKIFLEIQNDRLQVDFNPELYKPLFKEIGDKSRNKKDKPDAYYFYGFLSGRLSLKRIQVMLAKKKTSSEKESEIVDTLKKRDTWDTGFHGYDNKPVLIRHNLKNQKEVK